MTEQNVIFIPPEMEEVPLFYFPSSNSLQRFLRKENVKIVDDLKKLSPEILEQIIYNKKKPYSELKQLILAIQDSKNPEIIFTQKDSVIVEEIADNLSYEEENEVVEEVKPIRNLNDLIEYINEFILELKENDKDIFLGRLGATIDEKPTKIVKICGKYKLSPDFVAQLIAAIVNEIKSDVGQNGRTILKKLLTDCNENLCPLTTEFLVYLTNNEYDIFLYPPSFYIRLFEKLFTEIPIFIENENNSKKLGKDALKMTRQIKNFLSSCSFPVSLTEVFKKVIFFNLTDQTTFNLFFEAIQSKKFSLIKSDKPNELFIEINEAI